MQWNISDGISETLKNTTPGEHKNSKKTSILCHVHEIKQVQRKGQISNEEENKHKTGI